MDKDLGVKIQAMTKAGQILATLMDQLLKEVKVGLKPIDLDELFDKEIKKYPVKSGFKGYKGFPNHLCVGVNDNIVHCIPSQIPLKEGDIITIDAGTIYQGYYADMSRTAIVGEDIHKLSQFIQAGREALTKATKAAKVGNRLGDIGWAIQSVVEYKYNYVVSREFVGHGIGAHLHEDPLVLGYGKPKTGEKLKEGQTLAIEVIMMNGSTWDYKTLRDGWTTKTADGSKAAVWEDTILVTKKGGLVLTKSS